MPALLISSAWCLLCRELGLGTPSSLQPPEDNPAGPGASSLPGLDLQISRSVSNGAVVINLKFSSHLPPLQVQGKLDKQLEHVEDVKQFSGQSLTCDGWDSNAARPLMNFIAVTPGPEIPPLH